MNTISTPQENYITVILDKLRRAILAIAYEQKLDPEDALQESYLIIHDNWQNIYKIPSAARLAYACAVIREALPRRLCSTYTLSLDMPITHDSKESYADVLAESDKTIQLNEKVARIVHTALHQCTLEEQQYARDELGLEEFKPLLMNWRDKSIARTHNAFGRTRDYLKDAIFATLKMDRNIQKLIQRETCVL